jgi:hypothetical protein
MEREIPCFSSTDLLSLGVLPIGWVADIHSAVERVASPVVLRGGTSTSLEPPGSDIPYRLVDGCAIREQLPWLDSIYRGELADIASVASAKPMLPTESIRAGVNLNVLDGPGGRYELHVDSNPVTGLLFVTTHEPDAGGQLLFRLKDGDHRIIPRSGTFITFDAREIPHAVTPLVGREMRITAPMNFYDENPSRRPDDLDDYLYETAADRPKGDN